MMFKQAITKAKNLKRYGKKNKIIVRANADSNFGKILCLNLSDRLKLIFILCIPLIFKMTTNRNGGQSIITDR